MQTITALRNRTLDYTFADIVDGDGAPVELSADHNLLFRVGRGSDAPLFEVESDGAGTPAGSTLTFEVGEDTANLHLDQDDMDLSPGIYDAELLIFDADGQALPVQEFAFEMRGTLGGEPEESSSSS